MNKFPREKLIEKGSENLTNSELLSVILGIGSKKENVFNLSARLIQNYGNPSYYGKRTFEQIKNLWNVSTTHACKILALMELGKRLFGQNSKKIMFRNPKTAAKYFADMRTCPKEQFRALFLSTQNTLLADEIVSIGTLDRSIVHPRDLFRLAYIHNAASIIIAHNHPSGNPFPSEEDIYLTKLLKDSSEILKLPILDHIIIGENSYFSFEEGDCKKLAGSIVQS